MDEISFALQKNYANTFLVNFWISIRQLDSHYDT